MRKWRRLIRVAAVLAAVIVLLLPLSADAVTSALRPNAAGDEALLTPVGAAANWDCVNDITTDEDTTYVESANLDTYSTDLYNLEDVTVSGRGKINSVTVYIRARSLATPTQPSAYTRIKTNGVAYDGTAVTLTISYADYSTVYTTNPQTSAEWTWLEINNLQAGVGLRRALTTGAAASRLSRATQVWVVVDYTAATFESYKESAHTTVWGTAINPYDGTTQTAYLYGLNYIKSHLYDVVYYEADGDLAASDNDISSDASNTLSSAYLLSTDPTDVAGTWHAVVFDNDFGASRPATYAGAAGDAGYLVEDSFEVTASAIPEIPTVLAGLAVAGACAGLYWWMRKRRFKYVQA